MCCSPTFSKSKAFEKNLRRFVLQMTSKLERALLVLNALASRVLTALQSCGTLLSQCDILKIEGCP